MKTLHIMVLKNFIPVLLVSLFFFVFVIELVDLFQNLWRYINLEVPMSRVALIVCTPWRR